EMSVETVRLTVELGNRPAIEFYRSLGFRVEEPDGGVRRGCFEDRLVMSLALDPGR
ncbi:MAG: GNAT family N-acetyltransferase, partial [Streptomyces sp.]|nr:GNAT family N-acetyltransferase [Streptomyces sp.]